MLLPSIWLVLLPMFLIVADLITTKADVIAFL